MMKRITTLFVLSAFTWLVGSAQSRNDSLAMQKYTLNEVVVTGTRNKMDVRYLPLNVNSISHTQIDGRYEQSLLPLLSEQVPGLFVSSRGIMGYGISTGASGGIKIRGIGGSPTTDVLILIDGHPQYMGLMGHSLADAYQSILAEKIEVVSGPASVLYGSNAMGGVINILTRKQQRDGYYNRLRLGVGSFGTLNGEYTGMLKKGKFDATYTGSYNRTDGHRSDMAFDQYTGYGKMGYQINTQWRWTGEINVTHFNSSNPGTVSAPLVDNDSHITRGMASTSLQNEYQHTLGALTFYYNWGHHRINDGYKPGGQPQDYEFISNDKMLGVNWYQTANLFDGNHTTFGIDFQHVDGKAWNRYTDGRQTDLADNKANEAAAYIDFRQLLFTSLILDAGIRADHHSISGWQCIPQVGISWLLPNKAEFKALASKGYRNPTLRELYMFRSKNPDLKPESMMNYELSFKQQILTGRLTYTAAIFFINGKNMIETVMTEGKPQNMNSGMLKHWGIEASTTYKACTHLELLANYSFLHMKKPVTAAPKHKFYAEGNYHCGKFGISSGLQWINGLYTALSPDVTENFVLWNLRATYKVNKFLLVYAKGENLLAQRYEINAGFSMPRATFMGGIELNF